MNYSEEEQKAIERCNQLTKTEHTNWIGISNQKAIITILNLIQKQQEEIEYWKNGFERELEDNRSNTTKLLRQDLELRKKDKIIDEIAKDYSKYQKLKSYPNEIIETDFGIKDRILKSLNEEIF